MPVNSKQQQLSVPENFMMAMQDEGVPKEKLTPTLLAFTQEAAMPDTELKQFGNTLFISHFGENEGTRVAYMRALNADTARNFMDNGEKYFAYLIDKDINYMISTYSRPSIATAVKYMSRPEIQARLHRKLVIYDKDSGNGVNVLVVCILPEGK